MAVANVLQPRAPDSRCNQRCCFGPVPKGGGHLDLEVCSPGSSMPGGIALGDAVPAPGSLSAMDPRAVELGSPGYSDTLSPPISWRQVEGSAELACSRVAATDRLLQEAMAMVGQDILHLV
jgi:hypothetical protein